MTFRFFLIFILLPCLGFSQKPNKYLIEFVDKGSSPYCTCRPAEFLSGRAIERRMKAGIEVVNNDLPVSEAYIKVLKDIGLQIHSASRWLNAAVVICDTTAIKNVHVLPFVRKVTYLGPHLKFRNPPNRPTKKRVPIEDYPKPGGVQSPMGYANLQNSLLNVQPLYDAGHRGKGIWVAVMDGGFINVDTIALFDSLALQGRLHQGWDFVERDSTVFESAQHGTAVLSVMAGNLPGYYVGAAPDATYFLIKTEDTGGEFPIEEVNWITGAEWADSAGVDIINASLGYTSFNDTTLSHKYKELDGRTAIGSRGASIAATKGMIICNAGGNEGDGPWHYTSVPGDAPGIIAVGAVKSDGTRADFSSFGPTADGRIKPDLVAPGDEVVTAGQFAFDLGISSGTSVASPMLAGALAALWSACPDKTAGDVLDAVFHSADQYDMPDNERGWGLPDMTKAWLDLGAFSNSSTTFAFDRTAGVMTLLFSHIFFRPETTVELYDMYGRKVTGISVKIHQKLITTMEISNLLTIPPGTYFLRFINSTTADNLLTFTWP